MSKIVSLPPPFPAPKGVTVKAFVSGLPHTHRLVAGMYAGKFGYRVVRRNGNTPQAA